MTNFIIRNIWQPAIKHLTSESIAKCFETKSWLSISPFTLRVVCGLPNTSWIWTQKLANGEVQKKFTTQDFAVERLPCEKNQALVSNKKWVCLSRKSWIWYIHRNLCRRFAESSFTSVWSTGHSFLHHSSCNKGCRGAELLAPRLGSI